MSVDAEVQRRELNDRDRPTALVHHIAGMLLPGAPGNQD